MNDAASKHNEELTKKETISVVYREIAFVVLLYIPIVITLVLMYFDDGNNDIFMKIFFIMFVLTLSSLITSNCIPFMFAKKLSYKDLITLENSIAFVHAFISVIIVAILLFIPS